jgi:hypothetical protein
MAEHLCQPHPNLGGERTSDSDVEDEELLFGRNTGERAFRSHTHTDQPDSFHEEPLRAVEPQRSLMHRTNSVTWLSRGMLKYI